ncbi:hypothetical protein DFQ28_003099 [Apophysomyces sp. BC1034]|nr:hypothetical protein DFQ30_009980 [Apophysomyces sp. BC1015]KAG0183168.1 hypothetical protein DFQ29_009244 [Apophysomyces sp. BC1021]KAG0189671.1 hypothetical protein DFQ28_003099 [Apophysomyces sp. BC1034]
MGKDTQRNTTRVQRGHRMLDGLSTALTRKLDTMPRSELEDLRERNEKMLGNLQLIGTLPDKGAKLKDTVQQINVLLGDMPDTSVMSEEERSITRRVSDLKLDPTRIDVRKQSVELANAKAQANDYVTSGMLRINPASQEMQVDKPTQQQARVCMMSLDESLKLQESQLQSIKAEKLKRQLDAMTPRRKSESLADDLSLTMSRMQLDPEIRQPKPQDDDSDEDSDDGDDDGSDLNDEDYLYEDDEGFEEEEYMEEQNR